MTHRPDLEFADLAAFAIECPRCRMTFQRSRGMAPHANTRVSCINCGANFFDGSINAEARPTICSVAQARACWGLTTPHSGAGE